MPDVNFVLDPEVGMAISYAPAMAQRPLRALWALDARLAHILRTTKEPTLGQMKLTWWHDAVGRTEPIAGEPLLSELAAVELLGAGLQRIVEGWEALLDAPDDDVLDAYAAGRGGGIFAAAAGVLGTATNAEAAGRGWALVDLARHHSQPEVARRALALAAPHLTGVPSVWDRDARPLGVLAKLARRDLNGIERQGSPRRILAAMRLALTGW